MSSKGDQLLHEMRMQFKHDQNFKQRPSNEETLERRILLIGRPSTGKTSLLEMLDDPAMVPEVPNILRDNTTNQCKTIKCNAPPLHIEAVDTAGISGSQNIKERLEEIYQYCIEQRINDFHLICFCMSLEAGIFPQDLKMLRDIQQFFGENISDQFCLIVTRCESKTEEQIQQLFRQLKQNTLFGSPNDVFGKGVHFSGCLNYDAWYRGYDTLKTQFKTVCGYREKLLALVESANTSVLLSKRNQPLSRPPVRLSTSTVLNKEEDLSSDHGLIQR